VHFVVLLDAGFVVDCQSLGGQVSFAQRLAQVIIELGGVECCCGYKFIVQECELTHSDIVAKVFEAFTDEFCLLTPDDVELLPLLQAVDEDRHVHVVVS